jgi:hypothetical protein
MNQRLQSHNRQVIVGLVSICWWLGLLSLSSLAQEDQDNELITGKQFPEGFAVERSSLSPDKRYGVLVPVDFDHYDNTKPQNKLVEVETGRTLALINAETGKAGFMNHGGIEPSRWSADGSLLVWEVAGKWSPRALVLLKIEDGKVKWQRNLLKMAQQAILTRTRKFLPKDFVVNAATIDVQVTGQEDAPLSLPIGVHAEFDSNPNPATEPPPNSVYVHSEMEATIDSEGKLTVKSFRKQ